MSLTKVTYSMIEASPVNAFDFMTQAQRDSVLAGNLVEDVTVPLQAAITAASGKQLWMPKGNYKITGTLMLPQQIRMTGEVLRGGSGTTITAQFAGPAISRAPVSLSPCEILLQHLFIFGKYTVYGVGNGIFIQNSPSFAIEKCVVAGFGNNQIHIDTGSYACLVRDTYVAETWGTGGSNANIYCASEFCTFDRVESDDADYSILCAAGSYGTQIMHCTLEGWSTACIQINNSATLDRSIVQGNKLNNTRGGYAMSIDSNRCNIINNQIITSPALLSTQGIYLGPNSYGSIVIGNHILAGTNGTGIWVENSGYTTIIGNDAIGAYGLDMDATTYPSTVEGNFLSGTVTSAILRSAATRLKFANNTTTDGAGVIKQPAVVGGKPTADFWVEFTPSLLINNSPTGITYATNSQKGRYTKNGNRVFFDISLVLTSKGASVGAVTITDLPFASINDTIYQAACAIHAEDMAASATTMLTAKIAQNVNKIDLYKFAAGVSSTLNDTDINNTTTIIISGQYLANTF